MLAGVCLGHGGEVALEGFMGHGINPERGCEGGWNTSHATVGPGGWGCNGGALEGLQSLAGLPSSSRRGVLCRSYEGRSAYIRSTAAQGVWAMKAA